MFMTGVRPRWSCSFYHKDADHIETDHDLRNAMETADDFAFTSRLSSGVSFDQERYDVLTCYFTPQANLPRNGAQQLVRARNISCRAGVISIGAEPNIRALKKPLGYEENKLQCLQRESFSLNLLNDWGAKQRTLRVCTPEEFRPLYYHLANEKAISARPRLYRKLLEHFNYQSGYKTMPLGCWEKAHEITVYLYE